MNDVNAWQGHVILSEAKDLLTRIEHRKKRSFASLRMTAFLRTHVVHHRFYGAPGRYPAQDDTLGTHTQLHDGNARQSRTPLVL